MCAPLSVACSPAPTANRIADAGCNRLAGSMPADPVTGEPVRILSMQQSDAGRVLAVDLSAFFFDPTGHSPERSLAHFDWDRTFAATQDPAATPAGEERLSGIYTAYDMAVTAPGPEGSLSPVPMAGLSWVSVHPDHRRRGVLSAMIRHHLHDLHQSAAAPTSGLHAAEVPIYGRFGYGVASVESTLELGRGTTFTAPSLEEAAAQVNTSFVAADSDDAAAVLHDLHVRCGAATLGAVVRPERMARPLLVDVPAERRDREPLQVMFARVGGEVTGYALFSRKQGWVDFGPNGTVNVPEIAALDPASLLALARRVVDFDLTVSTRVSGRGLDDPLTWWAGGPRAARLRSFDSLWIRVVDVDAALTARGYAVPCDLVLDVADELCPWNAGCWRLTVDAAGTARCVPTQDEPELRLPVAALGSAYLGGRSIMALAQQGLVAELRPGAVQELSRAMQADLAPTGAIEF